MSCPGLHTIHLVMYTNFVCISWLNSISSDCWDPFVWDKSFFFLPEPLHHFILLDFRCYSFEPFGIIHYRLACLLCVAWLQMIKNTYLEKKGKMWLKGFWADLKMKCVLTPEGLSLKNLLILPLWCHQPPASGMPQYRKRNRKCFCLSTALQSPLFYPLLLFFFIINFWKKIYLWRKLYEHH